MKQQRLFVLAPQRALAERVVKGRAFCFVDTSGHEPVDFSAIASCQETGGIPELLIADDYFEEVRSWLAADARINLTSAHVRVVLSRASERYLSYRSRYADDPLRDIIVFRSGPHPSAYVPGMDFSDNARALFEYMLREHFDDRYELVWFVHDPQEFAGRYLGRRVTFLPDHAAEGGEASEAYYEKLCLARWIFFTDAYGFCRYTRSDQVRVQLWHGCGFKTRVNFVPCEHRYEYNIVVSPLYQQIHEKIYGLRNDQVLVTGYPKEDWLYHRADGWQERLGVPQAKTYIFWLPTFRKVAEAGLAEVDAYDLAGDTGLPVIENAAMLEQLEQDLAAANAVLLIKLHPFQDVRRIHAGDFPHICLVDNETLHQADLQINEVLADADALISDYSSAAVDFMVLDRPIAFTVTDIDEYIAARGFVFDDILEWLPGAHLSTFEDFQSFVRDVCAGKDGTANVRARLNRKMHSFFDDRSSQRVCEALGIAAGRKDS